MRKRTQEALPLPSARGLTREQAAEYLGIGVSLLQQIGPRPVRLGRRCVYDRVDLDAWLDDYKSRGRAVQEEHVWLVDERKDYTGGKTRRTGGSMRSSRMGDEYAEALGFSD